MNVICYGDSNTWGYDPRGYFGQRYSDPWPELLAKRKNWNVLNQGQNGREIPGTTVCFPKDTALLIIMLGTNDLLQGNSVERVSKRMEAFLQSIELERSKILLIAPPPMQLGEWVPTQRLVEASAELAKEYQVLSRRMGVGFADAGRWDIPLAFDGVHLTQEGHRAFARGLADDLEKEGINCVSG